MPSYQQEHLGRRSSPLADLQPSRLQSPALLRARTTGLSLESNPYEQELTQLLDRGREPTMDQISGLFKKYGFGMLNDDAIAALHKHSRISKGRVAAIFSGLGYAEEQMAQTGLEVAAFDRDVPKNPWFREVKRGSVSALSSFGDRLLFMCFPEPNPRNNRCPAVEAIRVWAQAGGEVFAIVSPEERPGHIFGADTALYELLEKQQRLERVALPGWPSIAGISAMFRTPYHSMWPVLEIYRKRCIN